MFEEQDYVDNIFDDVSGRELDPDGVREARHAELELVEQMGVWEVTPRSSLGSDVPILKGRWVDVNKGDEEHPNLRSRYVAREIKRGVQSTRVAEIFAAMPL